MICINLRSQIITSKVSAAWSTTRKKIASIHKHSPNESRVEWRPGVTRKYVLDTSIAANVEIADETDSESKVSLILFFVWRILLSKYCLHAKRLKFLPRNDNKYP